MKLEYLKEQKVKYQNKSQYFAAIDFNNLANDFQGVVDLISKMEDYINEEHLGDVNNEEENKHNEDAEE